jgi:hypothetical protein
MTVYIAFYSIALLLFLAGMLCMFLTFTSAGIQLHFFSRQFSVFHFGVNAFLISLCIFFLTWCLKQIAA